MKEKIASLLKEIQKQNDVTVLFAVENGSRAWGMASQDSDYDVRFVFYRPVKDYVTIGHPQEVITTAYDKDLKPHEVKGSLVDMSGFDIFKYLKLLSASNPTAIEWLYSPIVYLGDNNLSIKGYMAENFNQEKLFFHYYSLFKNSFTDGINKKGDVTLKKYLYALRGLLNARYVLKFNRIPPLSFRETVKALSDEYSKDFIRKVNEVIDLKSAGQEKTLVSRIPIFDAYCEEALKQDFPAFEERDFDQSVFDDFLRQRLGVQ